MLTQFLVTATFLSSSVGWSEIKAIPALTGNWNFYIVTEQQLLRLIRVSMVLQIIDLVANTTKML